MTGSSGDTFVTTVGTNGATSLVTVDTAAAAAHLTITADGTVDIDSAGVLTLDSGAAINIEPASGSAILLDGTISIDAGVVTGATSITSTAFVGGLTGNVTGNASGTALTVTQAAQTAITSVGTLTALTTSGVLDLTGTTDSSDASGDTGILRVEGGASIAKKLYIGTDLDVDGTANLDVVDIDGAVDMATTAAIGTFLTFGGGVATDAGLKFDGNAVDFYFGLDDSTDKLTLGANSGTYGNAVALTIDENGKFTLPDNVVEMNVSGNYDNLILSCTDADANAGPNLRMYRNSDSPADNDVTGVIDFEGVNDANQDVIYSQIKTRSKNVADGSEEGEIQFGVMVGGTLQNQFTVDRSSVIVNEDSLDVDFRVESNGNANMLFVNGGTNEVGIGKDPVEILDIYQATGHASVALETGSSSANAQIQVASDGDAVLYTRVGGTAVGGTTWAGLSGNNQINIEAQATSSFTIGTQGDAPIIFATSRVEAVRIDPDRSVGFNEADPDVSRGGLCLNLGDADGEIMTFKSSDIAHGMTDNNENDTFGTISKYSATLGGLAITGYSEDDPGLFLRGRIATVSQTEATNSDGAVEVDGMKKSNATSAVMAADDNIFCVGTNNNTQFIVKGDGELFSNQSATVGTYDNYDDAQLVRAYDLAHSRYDTGLIDSKFDQFVQYNKDDLLKAKLIGKDKDGNATSFVNYTGMSRLHNGAIWQQYEKHANLAKAVFELAKAAIGEEKALEILAQNEVKLLN